MPRSSPRRPYYVLTVPGVETAAAGELRAAGVVPGEVLARFDRRDSLILFEADDARPALRCGTLEDVFALILDAATPAGRSAPAKLAAQLDATRFAAALAERHALRPKRAARTFRVITRVAGRHPFERLDVERRFGAAVQRLLPRWHVAERDAVLEVWVHVLGDRTIAGLRLSGDEFSGRRYKRAHLPASLKPTLARTLALLSAPRPDDIVVDICCGAGTVLRERADAGPAHLIAGGDIAADAVSAARENCGRSAHLARWDATRLPLRDGSVDAVIVNPPYGRQHGAMPGLPALYRRLAREIARVLREHGRAVILTGEPDVLSSALPGTLHLGARHRFLLRGLPVTAYAIGRSEVSARALRQVMPPPVRGHPRGGPAAQPRPRASVRGVRDGRLQDSAGRAIASRPAPDARGRRPLRAPHRRPVSAPPASRPIRAQSATPRPPASPGTPARRARGRAGPPNARRSGGRRPLPAGTSVPTPRRK